MKHITKLLKALKLFDNDATLSLTNIMMMVLVWKVLQADVLDWTTISGLFLTLSAYNGKKFFAKLKADKEVGDVTRLNELEDKIKSVASAAKLTNMLK